MARRWLLTVLTGTALSFGIAGTAGAQELDPLTLDAEVVEVTVTADAAEKSLAVDVTTDAVVEEADTDVSPEATATVSPAGPTLDVGGTTEVAGNELPIPVVTGPVEDTVAEPTAGDQGAAGSDVTPAPAPATAGPAVAGPAPVASTSNRSHSRVLSADGATARQGMWAETTSYTYEEGSILAPEVAPPAETLPVVAAAAPTVATDLSLPIIDTTPTVPALLRLLAGLLVVGAAATWQTVRSELA